VALELAGSGGSDAESHCFNYNLSHKWMAPDLDALSHILSELRVMESNYKCPSERCGILTGNIFEKSAEGPIKGIAGKPPSLVTMGDKSFEWDAKAGFCRQVQADVMIPGPPTQHDAVCL